VSTRRPGIRDSAVATGHGDDGTTGLLYGGRMPKDDSRAEACGTIDEAVAALGVARALSFEAEPGSSLGPLLLRLQRDLFVVGAELATNPDAVDRQQDGLTRTSPDMLQDLETVLAELERRVGPPREFIVPGETRLSAAIEVARTVVRRAERRVVTVQRAGLPVGPWAVPWLNRLADLLWVMARASEQEARRASVPVREHGSDAAPPDSDGVTKDRAASAR
jgi:cob(I)alamin adenosyltransferase